MTLQDLLVSYQQCKQIHKDQIASFLHSQSLFLRLVFAVKDGKLILSLSPLNTVMFSQILLNLQAQFDFICRAEQEGIDLYPVELKQFIDFMRRGNLPTETFVLGSNQCKVFVSLFFFFNSFALRVCTCGLIIGL